MTPTLCELKYTNKPFIIDKAYARILQQKVSVFAKRTKATKNIQIAIVSANGIQENLYSDDLICKVVTLKNL